MKHIYKMIVSFFAAAVMASCFSAGVSAHIGKELYEVNGYSKNEIALAKLIKSTTDNFVEEEVDISKYNVSYDRFADIYTTVILY